MTRYFEVHVVVGVYRNVQGEGIGIDMSYTGVQGQEFFALLGEMLKPAGFPSARAVWFERNAANGTKVSWNSLRIPPSVCQLHHVNPHVGAEAIRRWMRSRRAQEEFDIRFNLQEPVGAVATS